MDLERRTHLYARVERATELPMLVLAVAMAPLVLVPLLVDLPATVDRVLFACDWVIWAAFAAELGVKTYLAPDRRRYLISHWYDVVIVVIPFLRPLRAARVLRILQLVRVAAVLARVGLTWRRALAKRGLGYVLAVGGVTAVLLAALVALVEQSGGAATIDDFPTALWWAATTVTTVGYGDTSPLTTAGRVLGVLLMIVGIGVFGIFTASVAAYFVGEDDERAASEDRAVLLSEVRALRDEVAALRQSLDETPGG